VISTNPLLLSLFISEIKQINKKFKKQQTNKTKYNKNIRNKNKNKNK
jgi:hypothetical protein